MEINKEEKKEFNILYEDGIYRILIDTYQFILPKVAVTTREDGTTSSYSTNLGYFSTLGQAFDYLLEILIKDKVKVSENFKKDTPEDFRIKLAESVIETKFVKAIGMKSFYFILNDGLGGFSTSTYLTQKKLNKLFGK